MNKAARFMRLLSGYDQAHGTYRTEDKKSGSVKSEIKKTARTVREPVTEDVWEQHLAGTRPLGIIPIRADSHCLWGAIDIDRYDLDLSVIVRRLGELHVPAILCRTKSGGAHVYVFFSEPIPADAVMSKLRQLAARLGYGESEIFPKQDQMLLDRGDLGNWLNMPYFEGDKSKRYGVKEDGRGMSMSEFLDTGEKIRLSEAQFDALLSNPGHAEFSDSPPCLEILTKSGFPEGTRNNGLFALGVLAKKKSPDGWHALLEKWNHDYMTPPLTADEVKMVIRSVGKRDYAYRCKDQPLCSFCDSSKCRARKYGVGAGSTSTLVESIQILDTLPPLFFVTISLGGVVECDSATLLNARLFQLTCLQQLKKFVPNFKNEDWSPQVATALEKATLIEAPAEVGEAGEFLERIESFCTDRYAAHMKEEILLGKPWHNEADGNIYFRLADLQDFLVKNGMRDINRAKMTTRIRAFGGGDAFFNLRGRGVRVFYIPSGKFQRQTELHTIPPVEDIPI